MAVEIKRRVADGSWGLYRVKDGQEPFALVVSAAGTPTQTIWVTEVGRMGYPRGDLNPSEIVEVVEIPFSSILTQHRQRTVEKMTAVLEPVEIQKARRARSMIVKIYCGLENKPNRIVLWNTASGVEFEIEVPRVSEDAAENVRNVTYFMQCLGDLLKQFNINHAVYDGHR